MANKKTDDIETWFHNEICRWRTGASIAWTAILAIPTTLVCLLFLKFNLFHPVSWIISTLKRIISFSQWGSFGLIVFITVVIAYFNSRECKHKPDVLSNRFELLWSIVNPKRVVKLVSYFAIGFLLTRCITDLADTRFQRLVMLCSGTNQEGLAVSEAYCLNEGNLFINVFGAIIGAIFAMQMYLYQRNYIMFPIIQQGKFFQVKSGLFPLAKSSLSTTLSALKYYCVLYYLFLGTAFKRSIKRNMVLHDNDEMPINSIMGMLDFGLLWTTLFSGVFVHILLSLPGLIYKIYHTESVQFPVDTQIADFKNKCLFNAVSSSDSLLQYHGFQDLYLLSKYSQLRRNTIFSLTQLGGHPQNWNSLAAECITQLKAFTVELAHFNAKTMIEGPMKQLSGDKSKVSDSDRGHSFGNVDNLTFRGNRTQEQANPPGPVAKQSFSAKVVQQLKNRKALVFLLSEMPDKESQKLFIDSQKYIWIVQGLANLVIASYKEDTYGVVQKHLASILSTLLSLQETVEKHFKLGTSINRKPCKGMDNFDGNELRFALKSVIKSSLYDIVITFGEHLKSVSLDVEEKKKLHLFVEFKE